MKTFHKAPLALAITALMVAPAAFAQSSDDFSASSSIDSTFMNSIDVDLSHSSDTRKNFRVNVRVTDRPDNYSGALVDSKQFTSGNAVENQRSENNATVGSDTASGASGNVGINVAAGDNNAQANDAALAASDARDIFGQAEIYSAQDAAGNLTANVGSPNSAVLGSNSLQGATGNIGVNIAAGTSNAQQNSLAASANENSGGGSVRATVGGVQQTYGNETANVPHTRQVQYAAAVDATVTLDNVDLRMDQIGDVWPDIWTGNSHPAGSADGHFDLDTATQGGSDLNGDGGALAFNSTDDSVLSGTISGVMPSARTVYTFHSNDATLGGGALQGVSGNVGVNIAAGTNNLQRNSLAIASSTGGGGGGVE